jgi:hypothetical protein
MNVRFRCKCPSLLYSSRSTADVLRQTATWSPATGRIRYGFHLNNSRICSASSRIVRFLCLLPRPAQFRPILYIPQYVTKNLFLNDTSPNTIRRAPVPFGYGAGWVPEPTWSTWRRENSWPYWDSNSDLSIVQPVATHYTDCATPAPSQSGKEFKFKVKNLNVGMLEILKVLKNMTFGDITFTHISEEVSSPSSGSKSKSIKNQQGDFRLLIAWIDVRPWRWWRYFYSKRLWLPDYTTSHLIAMRTCILVCIMLVKFSASKSWLHSRNLVLKKETVGRGSTMALKILQWYWR